MIILNRLTTENDRATDVMLAFRRGCVLRDTSIVTAEGVVSIRTYRRCPPSLGVIVFGTRYLTRIRGGQLDGRQYSGASRIGALINHETAETHVRRAAGLPDRKEVVACGQG